MIAGEGLVGIVLAILAIAGVDKIFNLSELVTGAVPEFVYNIGGILLFAIIILTLLKFTIWKKRNKKS